MFKKHKKIFVVVLLFMTIFISGSIFLTQKINAQTGETKNLFNTTKWKWETIPVDQLRGPNGEDLQNYKINAIGFQNTIMNPLAVPGIIKDLFLGTISEAMQGLMYILAMIASLIFWIGAQLIAFFMSLNMAIFDMPLVEVGWKIVRDIANLGFVLAIIIIAVATIVRYEEYGTKKLLPKLIAAAILVNFSLTIGAMFIDFSNTLTNFFISRSSKGGDVIGMTTELANGFDAQKFLRTSTQDEKINFFEKKNTIEKSLASILSLTIAALFTFISAVSLLGIAIMLLVRFMYLSVLLLVSPIIWLFWVIPDTQSVWKSWWHSFMKWVFNAPILTSFLYLTVTSITALGKFSENYAKSAGSGINDSLSLTPDILIVIGNSLIMTGLLVAGLITANSLGIAGATTAYSLASKTGKAARGWAARKSKNAAIRAGTAPLRSDKGRELAGKLQTLGKDSRVGGFLAKITGVNALGRGLNTAIGKGDKLKDEAQKKYGGHSINQQSADYNTANDEGKAAILTNIAAEGKAIGDELIKAKKEIERAEKVVVAATAKDPNSQDTIEARERLDKAKESEGITEKRQKRFEEAINSLPSNTRDGLGKIDTYVVEKQGAGDWKGSTKVFDIANMVTQERTAGLFYKEKKARRYVRTIPADDGERRFEHTSGKKLEDEKKL